MIRFPEIESFIASAIETDGPLEKVLKVLIKEKYVDLEARSRPLRDLSGNNIGAIIVLADLTKTKKLESLRKDFVANVSHELRTPLTSIKGFTETLISNWDNIDRETKLQFLNKIYKNSDGLGEMVGDLLALSHIENSEGLDERSPEPIRIGQFFDEIKARFVTTAKEKGLRLNVSSEGLEDEVLGFRGLLVQAVSNLVSNGIYYTPRRGRNFALLQKRREYV